MRGGQDRKPRHASTPQDFTKFPLTNISGEKENHMNEVKSPEAKNYIPHHEARSRELTQNVTAVELGRTRNPCYPCPLGNGAPSAGIRRTHQGQRVADSAQHLMHSALGLILPILTQLGQLSAGPYFNKWPNHPGTSQSERRPGQIPGCLMPPGLHLS